MKDATTTVTVLSLAEICGPHCADVACVEKVKTELDSMASACEVRISFHNVLSLSPAFANALLLSLDSFKHAHPSSVVTLTHLTKAHDQVIRLSLHAVRNDQ